MNDVASVVRNLGGVAVVSRRLGLSYEAVKKWRERGRIPKAWEAYLRAEYPEAFRSRKDDVE